MYQLAERTVVEDARHRERTLDAVRERHVDGVAELDVEIFGLVRSTISPSRR